MEMESLALANQHLIAETQNLERKGCFVQIIVRTPYAHSLSTPLKIAKALTITSSSCMVHQLEISPQGGIITSGIKAKT